MFSFEFKSSSHSVAMVSRKKLGTNGVELSKLRMFGSCGKIYFNSYASGTGVNQIQLLFTDPKKSFGNHKIVWYLYFRQLSWQSYKLWSGTPNELITRSTHQTPDDESFQPAQNTFQNMRIDWSQAMPKLSKAETYSYEVFLWTLPGVC